MALHAAPVIAQIVRLPPQAEISRQRIQPLPLPDTPLQLRIQNPEKASVPKAVDEIEFSITRIKVTGATHFPEDPVIRFHQDRIAHGLLSSRVVMDDK
jgi:hypothetical protein